MGPAVLVDPDDAHTVKAGGVGGHDVLGGIHGDGVTVSQDNPSSRATAATVARSIISRRRM